MKYFFLLYTDKYISILTLIGSVSEPGNAGTPVIKSFVKNGRKTIDRAQDGIRFAGSRSK